MLGRLTRWLGLSILLLLSASLVSAQGAVTLSYGSASIGTLTTESPLSIFVFNGSEGDHINLQVTGITPLMYPTMSLLGNTQQPLATDDLDAFNLSGRSARITMRLPQTGTYTVLVGGTPGDFVISLDARSSTPQPLLAGEATQVTVAPGGDIQYYNFSSDPLSDTALQIDALSENQFVVELFDGSGGLVTIIDGGVTSTCIALPPGDSQYELSIVPADRSAEGLYSLSLNSGTCGASGGQTLRPTVSPVTTPEVGAPDDAGAGCTASSSTNINIRSGAGTDYSVVGTLFAGQSIAVTGQTANGWYAVESSSVQGYVSASVVTLSGSCDNLPAVGTGEQVQPPAATEEVSPEAPVATEEATPEAPVATEEASPEAPIATEEVAPDAPTDDGGQVQPPVATEEVGVQAIQIQPTAAPTDSPTPTTAAQTAPPDSNYALTVPLDGTTSLTDFVSYPDGDTEDRVSYNVSGLNANVALPGGRANLTISASCFGIGTEYITFTADGQTFACGQTVVTREVTFDSRTGGVRVNATGGQGTFVQWVLTASAARVN